MARRRRSVAAIAAVASAALLLWWGKSSPVLPATGAASAQPFPIQHVVIIMQENRSFDSYFGTFPGADGIPMQNGVPSVCVPNPDTGGCVAPYHDTNDRNAGGPHGEGNARADIDAGRMDGFVAQQESGRRSACRVVNDPSCSQSGAEPDVMGYHDGSDIPNYWAYAENFVLQDRMFEPVLSYSLPSHLFLVSGWSASCTLAGVPGSCSNDPLKANSGATQPYAWTDLTYLLYQHRVSWRYYHGLPTMSVWNPLPQFSTVQTDGQTDNVQPVSRFYTDALSGTLPAVSWVIPAVAVSEHPTATVSAGQTYVTSLINTVMAGPDWASTAIFLAWDDWGGFYDHVPPVTIDGNGYGLRVPGLVISPYARAGYIDHQTLSFDAYLKFIEDDFLGGQRIDPKTDGRPDARPDVRENAAQLGDLINDFDFAQPPRPPLFLPLYPNGTPTPGPSSTPTPAPTTAP